MALTENKDQENSTNYLTTAATAIFSVATTTAIIAGGCYIKPDFCISLISKATKTSTDLVIAPENTDLIAAWEGFKGTMITFAQKQLIPTQEQMITSAIIAATDSINDAITAPTWNVVADELNEGHNHGPDQSLMEDGDESGGNESGNESEDSHGITPKKNPTETTSGDVLGDNKEDVILKDGSPGDLKRTHDQYDLKDSPEAIDHTPKILKPAERGVSSNSEYSGEVRKLSSDDLSDSDNNEDLLQLTRERTASVAVENPQTTFKLDDDEVPPPPADDGYVSEEGRPLILDSHIGNLDDFQYDDNTPDNLAGRTTPVDSGNETE